MTGPVGACCLCGRTLRKPASVEARIGPVCRAKRDRDARRLLAALDAQTAAGVDDS